MSGPEGDSGNLIPTDLMQFSPLGTQLCEPPPRTEFADCACLHKLCLLLRSIPRNTLVFRPKSPDCSETGTHSP